MTLLDPPVQSGMGPTQFLRSLQSSKQQLLGDSLEHLLQSTACVHSRQITGSHEAQPKYVAC